MDPCAYYLLTKYFNPDLKTSSLIDKVTANELLLIFVLGTQHLGITSDLDDMCINKLVFKCSTVRI